MYPFRKFHRRLRAAVNPSRSDQFAELHDATASLSNNDAMFTFLLMLVTKKSRIFFKKSKRDKYYSTRHLLQEFYRRQRSCSSFDRLL